MEINLGSHIIKIAPDAINKYDIYRTYTAKEGKNKGELKRKIHAFGISLERAVQIIIQDRLEKNEIVKDLDTFLIEYKNVSEKVIKEIKKIL